MSDINLMSTLSKLSKMNKPDKIRFELYSCYTTILLSKDYFKKNEEIKKFLDKNEIFFKDYLFASRTLLLSRMIRIIKVADEEKLHKLLKEAKELVFNKNSSENNKKKSNSNYYDSILSQFGDNNE